MGKKIVSNQPLSVDQAHTAQAMLETGSTVKDVAEHLGLVYANGAAHNRLKAAGIDVRSVRKHYGISTDKWLSEMPRLIELIRARVPLKLIAEHYNLSYRQMYSVLYRRGVSIRREQHYKRSEGMANG